MRIDRLAGLAAAVTSLVLTAPSHAQNADTAYRLQVDPARYKVQTQPGWRLPPAKSANPVTESRPFADAIAHAAARAGIEIELLHAIVKTESGYRADARSHKGATGLTQLMPATAARYDPAALTSARRNLDVGARYLRSLLTQFDNQLTLAIAAYNAGPGAVTRHGGIPPYPETRAYVARVLAEYEALKSTRHPIPQPWQLGSPLGDAATPAPGNS